MPFYHYGMHHVQPIGARFPRRGQHVTLQFGEPTVTDDHWRRMIGAPSDLSDKPEVAWQTITSWVEEQLLSLEEMIHPDAKSDPSAP